MARRRRPLSPPRPCSSRTPSDSRPRSDNDRSRHSSSRSTRGSSTSTAGRTATPSVSLSHQSLSAFGSSRPRSPSRRRRGNLASSSLTSLVDLQRDMESSASGHLTSSPRPRSGSPPRPNTRYRRTLRGSRVRASPSHAMVRVILDNDVSFIHDLPYCPPSQVALAHSPDIRLWAKAMGQSNQPAR